MKQTNLPPHSGVLNSKTVVTPPSPSPALQEVHFVVLIVKLGQQLTT